MTEDKLGAAVPEDETPTPETFDVEGWVGGVRPMRKKIRAYLGDEHPDMLADLSEVDSMVQLLPNGKRRDSLLEQLDTAVEDLADSATVLTIEARGKEWREAAMKKIQEAYGEDGENVDAGMQATCAYLAAHIVEPEISAAQLFALWRAREAEIDHVYREVVELDSSTVTGMSVVTRDFSRGRSGRR